MSAKMVHVWRMVHAATPNFAAGDELIACETPDESEARTRAGWAPMGPQAPVSSEYLGEISLDEFYERLAEHRTRGQR